VLAPCISYSMNIPFFDKSEIAGLLDYPTLIKSLDEAFRADTMVIPPRYHHDYQGYGIRAVIYFIAYARLGRERQTRHQNCDRLTG